MPIDYKKTQKELYQPKTTPAIIDVPEMTYIAVDGKGNPNTSVEYSTAIEALYGLPYAIKLKSQRNWKKSKNVWSRSGTGLSKPL